MSLSLLAVLALSSADASERYFIDTTLRLPRPTVSLYLPEETGGMSRELDFRSERFQVKAVLDCTEDGRELLCEVDDISLVVDRVTADMDEDPTEGLAELQRQLSLVTLQVHMDGEGGIQSVELEGLSERRINRDGHEFWSRYFMMAMAGLQLPDDAMRAYVQLPAHGWSTAQITSAPATRRDGESVHQSGRLISVQGAGRYEVQLDSDGVVDEQGVRQRTWTLVARETAGSNVDSVVQDARWHFGAQLLRLEPGAPSPDVGLTGAWEVLADRGPLEDRLVESLEEPLYVRDLSDYEATRHGWVSISGGQTIQMATTGGRALTVAGGFGNQGGFTFGGGVTLHSVRELRNTYIGGVDVGRKDAFVGGWLETNTAVRPRVGAVVGGSSTSFIDVGVPTHRSLWVGPDVVASFGEQAIALDVGARYAFDLKPAEISEEVPSPVRFGPGTMTLSAGLRYRF